MQAQLYCRQLIVHIILTSCLVASLVCIEEEKLIDTGINGLIAAFGDFDSDRFTDVFYISNNGKSLHLLKSYETKPELRVAANVSCTFTTEEIIAGVIPGDFNGDAMMDVMVVTQVNKHTLDRFNIWIFRGDGRSLDCNLTNKAPLVKNAKSHPLVMDFNGDQIADFLITSENCSRELWTTYNNKQFTRDCPANLRSPEARNGRMRFPSSNAFVNIQNCIDGTEDNFSTDIFITGEERMEYWFDDGGFSPTNTKIIKYPDQEKYIIGQSLFIDLKMDGCLQQIIVVCQKNLKNCDPQILLYNYREHIWEKISDFNDESNQTNLYFEEIKSTFGFELPIAVRSGDVDGDGYVDLVCTMKSTKDQKTRAVILRNVKNDSFSRSSESRKFVLIWTSELLIRDNVELATFFDLQENGRLDLIITARNSTNEYNILWVRNIFTETSCFLKVLVTTGLCGSGVCPNEKVPYGTNQAGSFVCYETSDMDGKSIKGCATQLSQSAHFALQMPYSVFGLGETPNFVETVQASIPSGEKPVRKARWTQIVPDAAVVLIPYPPNETTYWIAKLFYTPSSIIFSTFVTLAVLCCVLIFIIIVLHRKEYLEDMTEHEEYKRHWPESR